MKSFFTQYWSIVHDTGILKTSHIVRIHHCRKKGPQSELGFKVQGDYFGPHMFRLISHFWRKFVDVVRFRPLFLYTNLSIPESQEVEETGQASPADEGCDRVLCISVTLAWQYEGVGP